jgi:hypothetical protein
MKTSQPLRFTQQLAYSGLSRVFFHGRVKLLRLWRCFYSHENLKPKQGQSFVFEVVQN